MKISIFIFLSILIQIIIFISHRKKIYYYLDGIKGASLGTDHFQARVMQGGRGN